jgi:hypothetical protein
MPIALQLMHDSVLETGTVHPHSPGFPIKLVTQRPQPDREALLLCTLFWFLFFLVFNTNS